MDDYVGSKGNYDRYVDPFGVLVLGDDLSTTSVLEARRWSQFYRERASFNRTLESLKAAIGELSGESRREAARQALPALIGLSEMALRRADLWSERVLQLS